MTPPDALVVAKQTLLVLSPELLLLLVATVMMTAGAFVTLPRRVWAGATAGALVAAMVALFMLRNETTDPYSSVALNDALSGYARFAFLLTGLILLGLAHDQVDDSRAAEFFGAFLMIHAGAMLVAASNELVFLFVGLELVSIPTYLLLYLPRRNATTQEAATKYFFLSIFSSGLLLFGLAYLYGLAGVSNLKALSYLIHWFSNSLPLPEPQLAVIALVFVMAGLGFRVAAVPFHWYAPDVYEGSPTVMAALLAWVPKGVGFLALIRVLSAVFGWERGDLHASEMSNLSQVSDKAAFLAGLIAIITMTLGNTVALRQDNLKRLFAYSSIAHAGYMMVGLAAAFRNSPTTSGGFLGTEGILLYLATYALMTLGALGVIIALSTRDRPVETVDDLSGLAWTHPTAALAMGLCLFSLAGVPPMAGFYGKFWIFGSALAVAKGPDARGFQLLTIIGVLNAAIGAYYYLRILMKMTFSPAPARPLMPRPSWAAILAVGACASLSLGLGLITAPLVNASHQAAISAVATPEVLSVAPAKSTAIMRERERPAAGAVRR
ncbi:MAG: proton-translocating NADH-quinone oxidoreductase, chain [Planctomycetota bacterium]|nr:proton-translocating NADH-quinone oxidoreductase, chain [Planctomycetota bacterium]